MAYGGRPVFASLNCNFPKSRISVILGGSGSGKTTILRLIGGLVRPQSGAVLVGNENVPELSLAALTTVRRRLGMMFQGGALLDSFSVFDNVALPLRERRDTGADEIARQVRAALHSVGVEDAENLLPGELSGGMLRRVALARAIIGRPSILLCDEPFSGLDPLTSRRMESLLREINRQFGMTMIIVSHDVRSALRMADHILLLLGGRAFQGSPSDLQRSDEPDVIEFLYDGDAGPSPRGNS